MALAKLNLLMILIALCIVPDSAAQSASRIKRSNNANANRVRLKTTVSAQMVESFLGGQSIIVRMPTGRDSVGSLIVKRQNSFKDEPLAVKPKITVDGTLARVEVARSLFRRLDYQPLRIRVYQTGINRIELLPTTGPEGTSEFEPTPTVQNILPEFFVRLKSSGGVPVEMSTEDGFRVTNDVFDHEIPFTLIKAINFDTQDQRKVTVLLKNGDNVSGEHHWPVIVELKTKWGSEEISLDEITSVTRAPSSRVVESGVESPKLIIENK